MTTPRRSFTAVAAALLAVACGKGTAPTSSTAGGNVTDGGVSGGVSNGGGGGVSGGGGTGVSVSGIAIPKELSALPTKSTTGNALMSGVQPHALRATRATMLATDSGTDYSQAQTFKFVDEQALSQFSIFNTIFKALGQTHYADPENVNQGPYGCMVDWDDKGGSSTGKQLVPWVVDSRMTTDASGRAVNQVKVWMQMEMGDGQMHLIKVALDLYEAPTQRADGSYADYGVWTIDAKFDENATGYFAASCSRDANGNSVVKLHQVEPAGGGQNQSRETRGILNRADASGYGIVSYPDQDCPGGICPPGNVTASYAYDASHVALQSGADPVVYKDRTAAVDMVNRYGLYDAATGEDVTKSHAFGFPIRYVDPAGLQHWGYYGAWQGRHQLGYDGMNPIPPGATVTRADLPPSAPAQSFTVSDVYTGTLVKRTLVPGDIQGLKGIVVQTWVNRNFSIGTPDGTSWLTCPQGQWLNLFGPSGPACGSGAGTTGSAPAFTDFASLVLNRNDPQQQVQISLMQQCAAPCAQPPPPVFLVFDGSRFWHTDWTQPMGGPMTQPVSNGLEYAPIAGDQMWINLGGPVYLSYDGTADHPGFVQKTVVSVDAQTFQATFDPTGDVDYALDPSLEYYFSTPGVNYVVKAAGAGYDVAVELQSVANPVDASTFVAAGTIFRQQWDGSACSSACGNQSTYRFDAAAMKLVYACVGSQDQGAAGKSPDDEVTGGQWGLVAYDSQCTNTHVQFNWDTPQGQGQGTFGTQQYLERDDGSPVILEDPIRLAPIQLANRRGDVLTLSLQFDGNWVNGLPDVYNELRNDGWVLTDAIADKVVVIPAGTEVVGASDATHYLFKPLQMNEYLPVIADPGGLDVSRAADLDLTTVPTFVDDHLGPLPIVPLRYSEGKLVE